MRKKFCLFLYLTFILISLLNCEGYTQNELKNFIDQNIKEKYDIIVEEGIISESNEKQLLSLLESINDKSEHDIFLVLVEKYSGDLDSTAENFANSYCSSTKKCVFILCDNSKHKIGIYFGKKTKLNSSDMKLKFDYYYSSYQDIYISLKELLMSIKDNISFETVDKNSLIVVWVIVAITLTIFIVAGICIYCSYTKKRQMMLKQMNQQETTMKQPQYMSQPQTTSQPQTMSQPQTTSQPQMLFQPQMVSQPQTMSQPQMTNQQQLGPAPHVSTGFGSNNNNL